MITEFEAARVNAIKLIRRLTDNEEFTEHDQPWARHTLVLDHVLPSETHRAVMTLRRRSGYTLDRVTAFELVTRLDDEKSTPLEIQWQLNEQSASSRSQHMLDAIRNHHDVLNVSMQAARAKLNSLTILPPEASTWVEDFTTGEMREVEVDRQIHEDKVMRGTSTPHFNSGWDVQWVGDFWIGSTTPPPWMTFPADEYPTTEIHLREALSDMLTSSYADSRVSLGSEDRDSEVAIQ